MDRFFTELGSGILERWQAANFSLERFPEIAVASLDARPPAAHVDVSALVRDFLLDDDQPFQTTSPFGEPELIVFDHPRFYIQILFWMDGTTEIHQHAFSGAFHVLAGSSLHAHFAFENVRPITGSFRLGDLRAQGIALLEAGDTSPIVSGPDCIHSLFHLDSPSITVVVRTHNDPGSGPQFTYLPPHVAIDPYHDDALGMRRRQLLEVLERTGDPDSVRLILEMLERLDLERSFFLIQATMSLLRERDAWAEAWDIFARKHGEAAGPIAATLDEIAWRDMAIGFRSSVTDTEDRFLLALLLNVPSREQVLALVAQRGGDAATILDWAEETMESSDVGAWILDAEFPPEVEVPPGRQGEVFLAALRYFLSGGEDAAVDLAGFAATGENVGRLRDAFARSTLRALVTHPERAAEAKR